jgi:hypothetical protein
MDVMEFGPEMPKYAEFISGNEGPGAVMSLEIGDEQGDAAAGRRRFLHSLKPH